MSACRLFLVRHGHTEANGRGTAQRLSGWTDVPLSQAGESEAAAIGERLRREVSFAAVYSSPLVRARHSARRLERARGVPLVIDPDLREIGCGLADGLTVDHVRAAYPDLWARNERQDDDDFRWPGGESYREFRERCLRAVRRIVSRQPGSPVAVFTHTGFVTQVVGAIQDVPAARWAANRPETATVTIVDWQAGQGTVVLFGAHCLSPAELGGEI